MRAVLRSLLLLAAVPAWADPTVVKFDVPGASSTRADSISPSGAVAGVYTPGMPDPCGHHCGFIRAPDGSFTTFSVFGAKKLEIGGIDSSGTVVGQFLRHERWQGFIRAPGGTSTKVAVHKTSTFLGAIIDSGLVLGWTQTSDDIRAFLRAPDGTVTPIRKGGCQTLIPYDMNQAGFVAASCIGAGQSLGAIRSPDGKLTRFGVPGTGTTYAVAIDEDNAVAGEYLAAGSGLRCFVRDPGGTFETFDFPSHNQRALALSAMATVNGDRQVIGFVEDQNSHYTSFVRHADGQVSTFDVSQGTANNAGTLANDIAASGMIAGSCSDDGRTFHGFIMTP
jgi:hypothetical protein